MTSRSNKSRLTFLVYDKQKTPYYINIQSSLLKLLITGLPLFALLSILILIAVAFNFKRIIVSAERAQPEQFQNLNKEIENLQTQLAQEKLEIESLQARLNQESTSSFPELDFFHIPQGMRDIRNEKILEIGQFQAQVINNSLQISFNITNLSKDKLAGHIFVLHYQGSKIQVYPSNSLDAETGLLKYPMGESFFTARYRPSQASFENTSKVGQIKIVIFSRMGDLLFVQTTSIGDK
jgi:hypothetical protein